MLLQVYCTIFGQITLETWNFPIRPGMVEWQKLRSHQEMVEVCQIPNDVLNSLSTEDLVKICLEYPLFFTMGGFNNLQQGFEQVSTEFNGFQELMKRSASASELLKIYQTTEPSLVDNLNTPLSRGLHKQKLFFIEFTLSQKALIDKLDNTEIKLLISEALDKLSEKNKYKFSTYSLISTPLLMCRILEFKKFSQYELVSKNDGRYSIFSNSVHLEDIQLIEELKSLACEYIKSLN